VWPKPAATLENSTSTVSFFSFFSLMTTLRA